MYAHERIDVLLHHGHQLGLVADVEDGLRQHRDVAPLLRWEQPRETAAHRRGMVRHAM